MLLEKGNDAWTIFVFSKRSKGWGFYNVLPDDGSLKYTPKATEVKDKDGGWWRYVKKGRDLEEKLKI